MTNCIRLLLVAILLLSMETFAHAVDSGAALSLTLPQAVALALRDNPDLALSRHRRQSAAVSVEAARGRFLPSLQGSAGATQNYVHQAAPGAPEAYRSANAQLLADLNLFNGFADSADLDSSRFQLQAAAAGLERQGQTVAFTTASRFIAILADGELVQVAEQNLKSQQDLEQQIDAFYQAGVRAVTDLYQQQAATAQAEFALLDARRNLQVDQLQLLQTLGRTPPASIEALPPDTRALDSALQNLDPARAFDQALAARPDLRAQQQQIAATREQTRAAKAGYLPSLDLQAATGTSYSGAGGRGSVGSQFDDNRGASIGLALSVPIFDRDQTRSNVAQARIGEADAATTLLKLQQQAGLEVGQALADYQRAKLQLSTAGRQLDYARQALAASEARYKVGAATWIELSNARSVFVQAEGDEVRARYAVLLQGLNIGYARGDLDALLALLTPKENPS
jgi:outer membrane protein